MRGSKLLLATGTLLVAALAHAGTKVQLNVVPVEGVCNTTPTPHVCLNKPDATPGACSAGTCLNGHAGTCTVDNDCKFTCTTDADCNVGTVSASSKLSFDGKLNLKGVLKGITDSTGAPVTTDLTPGTADDRVVKLCFIPFINGAQGPNVCTYLKVEVKKGTAKLAVNGSTVPGLSMCPLGHCALMVSGGGLYSKVDDPVNDCPGDNSGAAIATRLNDLTCESGGFLGINGFQREV